MAENNSPPDALKPQQPQNLGVPAETAKRPAVQSPVTRPGTAPSAGRHAGVGTALIVVCGLVAAVGGLAWWKIGSGAGSKSPGAAPPAPASAPAGQKSPSPEPLARGVIATTEELAKPWSTKLFNFKSNLTGLALPALVVRLPGRTYWGLSLIEPYGNCRLEFVTDLDRLRNQYGVASDHPMVADPCNGSVFDLLRYANGPSGLVRGDVIHGSALRPPIAIEIRAQGKQVLAEKIEE